MPTAEQYYAGTWTTFWEKFMIFLVRMPLTILWWSCQPHPSDVPGRKSWLFTIILI